MKTENMFLESEDHQAAAAASCSIWIEMRILTLMMPNVCVRCQLINEEKWKNCALDQPIRSQFPMSCEGSDQSESLIIRMKSTSWRKYFAPSPCNQQRNTNENTSNNFKTEQFNVCNFTGKCNKFLYFLLHLSIFTLKFCEAKLRKLLSWNVAKDKKNYNFKTGSKTSSFRLVTSRSELCAAKSLAQRKD